jgi:hypothetical protein
MRGKFSGVRQDRANLAAGQANYAAAEVISAGSRKILPSSQSGPTARLRKAAAHEDTPNANRRPEGAAIVKQSGRGNRFGPGRPDAS